MTILEFGMNWNFLVSAYYLLANQRISLKPIQDGPFRGCLRIGGGEGQKAPLSKICHTYPTLMKLGAVIPYLKKIQKIHKSRDTPIEFR